MKLNTKLIKLSDELNLSDIGLLTDAMRVSSKNVVYTEEQKKRIEIIKEKIKR